MSNNTCYECENAMYPLMCSNTLCPIDNENFAEQCGGFTQIQKPPKSLFDRLIVSQETMAEKLVYGVEQYSPFYENYVTRWYSSIIPYAVFDTKPEAISATVEMLKEVDECKWFNMDYSACHLGRRGLTGWNTCPDEDALTAEVESLKAALIDISKIGCEGKFGDKVARETMRRIANNALKNEKAREDE